MPQGKVQVTYHLKDRGSHLKNIQLEEGRTWNGSGYETCLDVAMRLTPKRGIEWLAVGSGERVWSFKVEDLDHIEVKVIE